MITKEQWSEVEKDLQGLFACRKFKLGNDEISITREYVKEGVTKLVVYFNGTIKGCWTHEPNDKHFNPLVEKFWHRQSRSIWKRKHKAALTKLYGKKRVKEKCPDLEERYYFYLPTWPRAKTLVSHLKKIPDLELIS